MQEDFLLRNGNRFCSENSCITNDNNEANNEKIVFNKNESLDNSRKEIKLNDESMIENAKNFAFGVIMDENSNDEITNQALLLLYDVVCCLRRNTNVFYDEDIVVSIIDLLYHSNTEIIINTLKLIFALSQGSRKPMNLFIKNELLLALLELFNLQLNKEEYESVLYNVIMIASNIAFLSSKKVHYLIQLGYSNLIIKAINEGNFKMRIAASFFISNIMTKGIIYDIQNSINTSMINHLFELLDEEFDLRLFHCILDGILICLQNQISIENVPLQNILKNDHYYNVLCALSTNEDEYTAETSQAIISLIEEQ